MNPQNFKALLLLGFALGAFASLPPESVSFSPKTWFPRDFQRLEALSLHYSHRRPKPLAFSDGKGLVAGTSSALAVHAGTEALRKGGNAVDACLTTALTGIFEFLSSVKIFSSFICLNLITLAYEVKCTVWESPFPATGD